MNGGNCSENGTSFSCQCPDGYTGQLCEIPSKYSFQFQVNIIFHGVYGVYGVYGGVVPLELGQYIYTQLAQLAPRSRMGNAAATPKKAREIHKSS
jgi:hypothetical protein